MGVAALLASLAGPTIAKPIVAGLGWLFGKGRFVLYAAVGGAVLLYASHYLKNQGRAEVISEVKIASGAESVRQLGVTISTLEARADAADAARIAAEKREKDAENVAKEARARAGAAVVCVPADVADKLRKSFVSPKK
jgi:hypothetical protein